ncbi:MAG: putative transporter [Firmicutes bacterium]|nr:putative transporter [Bacillota bacterium]
MKEQLATQMTTSIVKPATNYRWLMVFLSTGVFMASFMDRVNVAAAAPFLMKTFELTSVQMGTLMSAFFWPYMLLQAPSGWLMHHVRPRFVVFWSCFGWGLTTVLTGLAQGFNSFLALRVALGITEAPALPINSHLISVWIPKRERTLATAIPDSAARFINAITVPLCVWIITHWGWQISFVVTGGIAMAYSFVWLWGYRDPDQHPKVSASELAYIRQDAETDAAGNVKKAAKVPMLKMLSNIRYDLACLGYWQYIYIWTVYIMWIPSYLVKFKGFTPTAMGEATMIAFFAGTFFEVAGGYYCDKWLQSGASLTTVRRFGTGIAYTVTAIGIYVTVTAADNTMTVFGLALGMSALSFGASHFWAVANDLAPYGQGGSFSGLQNTIGQTAAIIAPILTGYMIDKTSLGFNGALYLVILSCAIGVIAYALNTYEKKIEIE